MKKVFAFLMISMAAATSYATCKMAVDNKTEVEFSVALPPSSYSMISRLSTDTFLIFAMAPNDRSNERVEWAVIRSADMTDAIYHTFSATHVIPKDLSILHLHGHIGSELLNSSQNDYFNIEAPGLDKHSYRLTCLANID